MTNSTAHSGPTLIGTLKNWGLGAPFLQEWKEATDRGVNILPNLRINVLESTIIPPNCIVLSGDYETVCLVMGIQLDSRLKLILQNWQDTGNGTWKMITSGEQNVQHLMLQWPTLAENFGATD